MLSKKTIAVFSRIDTKHVNAVLRKNFEPSIVKRGETSSNG